MTTPLLDSNGKLNGESVRYAAIGDSFTEGVGDVDRRRPNNLRGWADRVAEGIGAVDPQAQYANLAIRGRLLIPILEEQLPAALDLCPNIVTFYGGGNDIMRPNVDIDQLMTRVDEAFAAMRAQDITILTVTGLDVQGQGPFARTRGRTATYN
ncbi:SGNH/GDSL hydrolase family protein, partial [uncultured Rothia sp.]|uniref:SGNH/GDSL hydrolase family protein n=1 Tax=uncultured Rothia sp. TaxID=316088 RepID=UPI0026041DED